MKQTLVEASNSHYELTPRNDRRCRPWQVIEVIDHFFKDISALRWRKDTSVTQRFSPIVYLKACAMDQADIWVTIEQRYLSFELFRKPDVIAVEEGNKRGARCGNTDIPGVGGASMITTENPKLRPSASIFGKDRGRCIGRPIIDCNHGVRLEALCLYAIETDFDQSRTIVDRDERLAMLFGAACASRGLDRITCEFSTCLARMLRFISARSIGGRW
jgi:hypothetical protein